MATSEQSGFTLVELITVIVLIGVLAVVAGPRFFSASTFEDRFFFDDALHGARYARQFAVAKGCFTRFNLTTSSFSLNRDNDCNSSALNFSAAISRPEDTSATFAATNAPSGTVAGSIVFDPAGRAGQVSGSNFAAFTSTQTYTIGDRTFLVDGETGFVR